MSDFRDRMTLRPPRTQGVAEHMDQTREAIIRLVESIEPMCTLDGPSREWSLAMTAFEEACFWSIASIARSKRNMG